MHSPYIPQESHREVSTELFIKKVEEEDSGSYTCTATYASNHPLRAGVGMSLDLTHSYCNISGGGVRLRGYQLGGRAGGAVRRQGSRAEGLELI